MNVEQRSFRRSDSLRRVSPWQTPFGDKLRGLAVPSEVSTRRGGLPRAVGRHAVSRPREMATVTLQLLAALMLRCVHLTATACRSTRTAA